MKFIIIDGQFLLYKSLWSHQKLTAIYNNREIISGIPFGFVKAIIDMKIEFMPDFIFITWEGHPLIKKKAYPAYKQTRKKLDIDITVESDLTKAIMHSMKMPNLFSPGYEGEDVANFIRRRIVGKKNIGWFYTNDHDAFAMIRNNFVLINNIDGDFVITDKRALKKEYGITPKQAREMKILEGCKSDNVAGFPGIGPTYSKYLIKKYGTAKDTVEKINETGKYELLNDKVKKKKKLLTTMTYATKILYPIYVKQAKLKIKGNHMNILGDLECETLLRGANRRIMNMIVADQFEHSKKIMKKVKKERKGV